MSDIAPSPHHRLRRLKAALLAVSFTLAGILLMMLNAWLAPVQLGSWQWLARAAVGRAGWDAVWCRGAVDVLRVHLPEGPGSAYAGPLSPDHP